MIYSALVIDEPWISHILMGEKVGDAFHTHKETWAHSADTDGFKSGRRYREACRLSWPVEHRRNDRANCFTARFRTISYILPRWTSGAVLGTCRYSDASCQCSLQASQWCGNLGEPGGGNIRAHQQYDAGVAEGHMT